MSRLPLRSRAQGFFWDHSRRPRRLARGIQRELSVLLHRLRVLRGKTPPPRVVATARGKPVNRVNDPAITVVPAGTCSPDSLKQFLKRQTESSIVSADEPAITGDFLFLAEGELDGLPATHLESLLLAAAAEDLNWTVAGWSESARGRFGPSGEIVRAPGSCEVSHGLLRLRCREDDGRRPVLGRTVPHMRRGDKIGGFPELQQPFTVSAGPLRLPLGSKSISVVRTSVQPLDLALAPLPSVPGPRTALFLLPFLAVGGAERLLFDLLRGLSETSRLLVVSTDPHLETFGQTVDVCRGITPHVYTLGDWLPREALPGALRYLVRRWSVESLICWNGNVLFYDDAADLKRNFPRLRILNQLFNHEGGWIDHYSPSLVAAVDVHIAVNTPTAKALCRDRGVPSDRVETIHHGIDVPQELSTAERMVNRRNCRAALGLPEDTTVVGSFIRMHPQKRPFDIVRLADHMRDEPIHFLLVGGGPLDDEIDRELQRNPEIKLLRLPMQPDARKLYDALDICLLTSSFEGLPIFLLDGLARGIPCVAPAVGDIPYLLENGGGVVVDRPGDLDSFAGALSSLYDPDRRREEGERGRNQVYTSFGLHRFVGRYESAIFPKP